MKEQKEINTGKRLEEIKTNFTKVVKIKCVKPTKTLTKDKVYKALLLENKQRCNVLFEYTKEFSLYGIINDTGHYVEVATNRFK